MIFGFLFGFGPRRSAGDTTAQQFLHLRFRGEALPAAVGAVGVFVSEAVLVRGRYPISEAVRLQIPGPKGKNAGSPPTPVTLAWFIIYSLFNFPKTQTIYLTHTILNILFKQKTLLPD